MLLNGDMTGDNWREAPTICMRRVPIVLLVVLAVALLIQPRAGVAQLRGHGGPVRSLAVSADGASLVSGGFDTSAIRWSLATDTAAQVLRFHSGAVNAVAFLNDGRIATAGADARIAIWTAGRQQPDAVLEGHQGPIVALAVSSDGTLLASAAWDRTVRLWPLAGGAPIVLEGHTENVNGVAFAPDGRTLVSVGYDFTARIWPLPRAARQVSPQVIQLPSPLNAVAIASDGEIIIGGADGRVRFLTGRGSVKGEIELGAPVIALAISGDGALIAAAQAGGSVAIIDRKTRVRARTLTGAGPVWSLAFLPGGTMLLTGGADGTIRRWNAVTGAALGSALEGTPRDPLAAYAGDHGAEVFRACVACHTLREGEGERAGPSLAGLYGRRIATLPGYRYSEALKRLDIVWTPETVAKLFEIGPSTYTPGTKMPEQRIGSAEDRKALTDFLARATAR